MNLEAQLMALCDTDYRDFHRSLLPHMPDGYIIGVRMPQLRKLACLIDTDQLIATLPHSYYEENQLHAIVLSRMKDFEKCIQEVERFLPYVDNWATCDTLRPLCFGAHTRELLVHIPHWLQSSHEYTVRFGIGMLEAYCLDESFNSKHLWWVASIRREEYYIRMMQAWYFATALAKQWELTLPIIGALPDWVKRKTTQKALESYRISEAHKVKLKQMR